MGVDVHPVGIPSLWFWWLLMLLLTPDTNKCTICCRVASPGPRLSSFCVSVWLWMISIHCEIISAMTTICILLDVIGLTISSRWKFNLWERSRCIYIYIHNDAHTHTHSTKSRGEVLFVGFEILFTFTFSHYPPNESLFFQFVEPYRWSIEWQIILAHQYTLERRSAPIHCSVCLCLSVRTHHSN